jgi:hypothetical protein
MDKELNEQFAEILTVLNTQNVLLAMLVNKALDGHDPMSDQFRTSAIKLLGDHPKPAISDHLKTGQR